MSEKQTNKILKSGLWYTVGNFLTKAAGFITTPIFTRLLSKGQVGDYSNFVSWIELMIVLCTLDLFSSVMIAKYDFKDELDDYIATNLFLGTAFTFFLYFVLLLFKERILHILSFTQWQLNLAFIYMAVYPASQMFLVRSRIFYKYRSYVLYSLGATFISTIVSLVFTIIGRDRLVGRIVGQYLPLLVINCIVYLILVKNVKKIKFCYIKYGLTISVPLIWHTLSGNILSLSDRVMIRKICGNEATALYSVGYYCALIVSVLWSSMNNAWSPWAYDMMDSQNIKALKKASVPYVLFFSFVVICFLLIGPEILLLMGGNGYETARDIIPIIMVSVVFQFIYSLYVNIEFFNKKQIYIATGTTIAAIVNLILNYYFIPKYGYIAAAYTTLVGYIVLFLVHFGFVRHLGKTHYYSSRFIFTILIFFVLISFAMRIIYRINCLRYCLIAIMFIALIVRIYCKRKEIIDSLKKRSIVGIVSCLIGDISMFVD